MKTKIESVNMDNLKDIEKRLAKLESKRIFQQDIMPDNIKERHVGESVRFIRGGVTANKPTEGEVPLQGIAIFYDTTVKKLYCWNTENSAWDYVQFT